MNNVEKKTFMVSKMWRVIIMSSKSNNDDDHDENDDYNTGNA